MAVISNSQVDKAGNLLRRHAELSVEDPRALERALSVLSEFRKAHAIPLSTATMGLRSAVKTCGYQVVVTQRLKREATIVDKLTREHSLRLSTLQDVGGSRALLPSIAAIYDVLEQLTSRRVSAAREIVSVDDYIKNPRTSGYRAIHVIVRYQSRKVELQLRSPSMNEWAMAMEHLTQTHTEDFRNPIDPGVNRFLNLISVAMALEEEGGPVPEDLVAGIAELRVASLEYLRGRQR